MRDMTKGAPLGHLFLYAVPLLLGNWLQLAYNAVDSIIAGRFIGQDALAAEGVAGPVMNLVILAISGLCIGAGVLMSEAFGAKRTARLKETLATTLLFGAGHVACQFCECHFIHATLEFHHHVQWYPVVVPAPGIKLWVVGSAQVQIPILAEQLE